MVSAFLQEVVANHNDSKPQWLAIFDVRVNRDCVVRGDRVIAVLKKLTHSNVQRLRTPLLLFELLNPVFDLPNLLYFDDLV